MLRARVPVAAGLAAVIAAVAVLLIWQPWEGKPPTVEGSTIEWRACDLVLEAPVPGKAASELLVVQPVVEDKTGVRSPALEVSVRPRGRDRSPSKVVIGPQANVRESSYGEAEHRDLLTPILATARVEPLEPGSTPWPYTDSTQVPESHNDSAPFSYRFPDPGAGITVTVRVADGLSFFSHSLIVRNCRSEAQRTVRYNQGEQEPVISETWDVQPPDEEAFQRFFETVEMRDPE